MLAGALLVVPLAVMAIGAIALAVTPGSAYQAVNLVSQACLLATLIATALYFKDRISVLD